MNHGIIDKEVLALLRILDVCYTILFPRDQGVYLILDVGMAVAIFRSQWLTEEMGCATFHLDAGDQQMRKERRQNTRYSGCEHNASCRGGRNADRHCPAEVAEAYNKYAATKDREG